MKGSNLYEKNQYPSYNRVKHNRYISQGLKKPEKIQLQQLLGSGISGHENRYEMTSNKKNRVNISSHRPFTTNKNYSLSYNRKQQTNNHDSEQIRRQFLEQKKKQLWISTVKQSQAKNLHHKQTDGSRGKIFKGGSWFPNNKQNSSSRTRNSFYSKNENKLNLTYFQDRETPTQRVDRSSRSYSKKNHLIDLIGKNLNKNHNQEQYFEYVMRFSFRTKKGYIPNNSFKVNQDSYIITPNINKQTWQHFFGVCDGHGPFGHLVSNFIKNHLSSCIANFKHTQKNHKENLSKAFSIAYQKLLKQSKIDMNFSGSTVIGCYLYHNKLFCCNVGDSRAILGRQNKKGIWHAQALSIDHKPSLESQAQRVRSMGGRVQAYIDQYGQSIGPLRVWVKNDNTPGLAMTRSFGDLVGASVGVSPIPQIKQFQLTQDDKIILIASDGVFQFLENQEIIESLSPFYRKKDIQGASDYLLNKAHKTWTHNSSIIDDITFILIFLNYNENN